MNDKKEESQKPKDFYSRLKTALFALPILFVLIYFKSLYLLLMLVVIKITHSEYDTMQQNILNLTFNDYYAQINWKTLLSSPLTSLNFMLCPIILYFFNNSELFAMVVPISLLEMHRLYNFISIYRVLKTNETNFTYSYEIRSEERKEEPFKVVEKVINPLKAAAESQSQTIKYKEEDSRIGNNYAEDFIKKFGLAKTKATPVEKPKAVERKEVKTDESSLMMFNSCLMILMLDVLFYFVYVYPLCLGISVHNTGHGFAYILLVVVIAYQCDNGALFFGRKLGKKPFGYPVTPSKTEEGIYGGVLFGFLSAFVFRYSCSYFFDFEIFSHFNFFVFTSLTVFAAIFGDFFESFLKRCADVKDSGSILPGHGGLLDRIDSITLGIPMVYYFSL